MTRPDFTLITPAIAEPEAFAEALSAACEAGGPAAVILRLEAADERTLVNRVKALAPLAQQRGAAVLISAPGEIDLAGLAARGGADGVHLESLGEVRSYRERLKGDRILGIGRLRTKDDAMAAGEAGADYLLFGEPRPDGSLPDLDAIVERASWWAEIFETPCVAYAPDLDAIGRLALTGAEFVALGGSIWDAAQGVGEGLREARSRLVALRTGAIG